MISELQVKQSKIDNEIVAAIIDCTPEEYFDFELTLTYVDKKGQDVGSVEHVLTCQDGDGLTLTPSMDVFNSVRKLSLLFAEHSVSWDKIKYHVYCDEEDNWRFEANFGYTN